MLTGRGLNDSFPQIKDLGFSAQKMKGVEQLMRQIKLHGLAICVVTGSGQPSLLNKLVDEGANLVCRNMNEALTAFLAICHATGIAPVQ